MAKNKGQGILETKGVQFLRFSNTEIKKEMFSVLLALETKIEEIQNNPNPVV